MSIQKPNFIGIGVQRGGTSWLYQCVKQHPQIFMPQKEVHFFDQQFDKGIEWYESLFKQNKRDVVQGEITPDYLFDAAAMSKIAAYAPEVKLIVILRDPFDRAYSAYQLFQSHGMHKDLSFAQTVKKAPWILEQSLYAKQIEHLFTLFSKEQVRIYDFEDIRHRPNWLLEDLFTFLDIDTSFRPSSANEKFNVSGRAGLQNTLNLPAIQSALSANILGKQLLKLKRTKAFKKLKSWLLEKDNKPSLKAEHCTPELRNRIKKDLQQLSHLLNRNYEKWY